MGSWDQLKEYNMYEVKSKSQEVQDDTRTRYLSLTPSYSPGAGDGFFGWGTGAEAFCGGGGASCGGEKQSGPGYCGGGECAGCGARSYFF